MAGAALLDLDKPIEHFFGVRAFPEVVMKIHKGIQNESPDGMANEFAYGALFALADAAVGHGRRGAQLRAAGSA